MQMYTNPMKLPEEWQGNQLGDPFVFRHDGRYYLYCSSHTAGVKCWTSDDLVNFSYAGMVCDLPETDNAYAPEVCYTHGRFWMVTSPHGSGHYILVADAPTGPFVMASENFGLMIDASFFTDNDGREYLFRAGHQGIVAHPMPVPELPELAGTTIPESWLNHWTEGPMVIRRGNRYFLTYTGNHLLSRGYRIAYSVSEAAPDKGYRNLRNPTLLLETGDDFHGLGHSSTVLGPDMDSCFIAYHSFDFRPAKPFRSLNMDRLFFNEARMSVQATWWAQPAPVRPLFVSRGGEGLTAEVVHGEARWCTPAMPEVFTAEVNMFTGGKPIRLTLDTGSGQETVMTVADGRFQWSSGGAVLAAGELPDCIPAHALHTVRLSQTAEGRLITWINQLQVSDVQHQAGGILGIHSSAGITPGFVGFSDVAGGSGDLCAWHSVPGRFDAVHGQRLSASAVQAADNGMAVRVVRSGTGTVLQYPVNVREEGVYTLCLRVSGEHGSICLKANGQPMEGQLTDVRDGDGFACISMGTLTLAKGLGQLEITELTPGYSLDTLELQRFQPVTETVAVTCGREGRDMPEILGHKGIRSMIRKVSGFTCAENHGMAFSGSHGWTDYEIRAEMHVHPETAGTCSVYFRSTKESWFGPQVMPSLMGYRVCLDASGVSLYRCAYGERKLAEMSMPLTEKACIGMTLRVKGNDISLVMDNGRALYYTDADAWCAGKAGFEATGEGFGFETFRVSPL